MKYIEQRTQDWLWACPCGLVAPYFVLCGHRKGIKKAPRPKCVGQIKLVGPVPNSDADKAPVETDTPTDTDAPPVEHDVPQMLFVGNPNEIDTEELARRYNEQRSALGSSPRSNGHNGHNGQADNGGVVGEPARDDLAGTVELAEGDWRIEHPPGVPDFSQASVTIRLPVKVQNYYDWCKANGWGQGLADPSISMFMVDVVLEHMEGCLGLAVYIGKREEVMNG